MADIEVPSREIAQAISAHLDEVSAEQVHAVLHALNKIQSGDPIGMVRRDPATGHVALRFLLNGIGAWRVAGTDGELYVDEQTTLLNWDVLYTPEEGETK